LLAFAFGLLHGAAFASGLAEVGLPRDALLQSLLLFNVGVELGQLIFVAVVLVLREALNFLPVELPPWSRAVPSYAIGTLAGLWFLDRLNVALG
jgi:hypothetical protein